MQSERKPTPDTLFHTLLTIVDYHTDPSGGTQSHWVLGTHTMLPAAKAFARKALSSLGYERDDFKDYEEAPAGSDAKMEEWTHGDGYIVWARAPAGQVFEVNIDAKSNAESLLSSEEDTPMLPKGVDHLHYVMQTRIDYNKDRNGAEQETEVEGAYVKRGEAMIAAKGLLLKREFEEYDERDEKDSQGEWEFWEDVVVHAVKGSGENFDISVKTVPGVHQRHGKKKV